MATTSDPRPPSVPARPDRPPLKVDDIALGRSRSRPTGPLIAFGGREAPPSLAFNPFLPRRHLLHPPSARNDPGADIASMAMDEQIIEVAASWAGIAYASAFAEGVTFLGYAYLSELAQRPEYRAIVGTIAEEMTRKGFKLVAKGTQDKAEKISQLDDELKRLKVIDVLREVNEHDSGFGRGHIYLDTGDTENRPELKIPLGNGWDEISKAKVNRERPLQRVVCVEPVWAYPTNYNSNDPLRRDWYRPQYWFVQGKELHISRLLTFIGREVPDLLKPAYSFGGLATTQMVKPYVDNWLRTRQSVADLIHAFSVFVLATDLQSSLQNGGEDLFRRLSLFTNFRDNRGLMVTNKETEELQNVSAPLGTLDALQAQTQEHMAAVSRIPLVKLLGIQPAGLNASSEGEIRTFYDTIAATQAKFFNENLHRIVGFAMLSLWGETDPDITFEWESLWALDEKGEAEVRKLNAETGAIHINAGVIDPAEERERVAREPGTPYQNLDIDDVPEPPQEADTGEGTGGKGGDVHGGTGPSDGSEEREDSSGAADAMLMACDAGWTESDHPRGQPENAGQFGSGGGGGGAKPKAKQTGGMQSFPFRVEGKTLNLRAPDRQTAERLGQAISEQHQANKRLEAQGKAPKPLPTLETLEGGAPSAASTAVQRQKRLEAMRSQAVEFKPGVKVAGHQTQAEALSKDWYQQGPTTPEALEKASPANQKALADVCNEVAQSLGVSFKDPGPKSRQRIEDKIGRGRMVTDAVRGGFDVQTPEQGEAIIKALAAKFEVADEGWQKTPAGYFDRKTIVRFPDGQVGEIQMWPPGMLAAKEDQGHKLYAEWQGLKEPPPSTDKGRLLDAMVGLYAGVQASLPADWSAIFK